MTGFATDTRLGPGCFVSVSLDIVVSDQLTDMAAMARGIEGVHGVRPGQCFVALRVRKVTYSTCSRIEPLFQSHVIRQPVFAGGLFPEASGSNIRSCPQVHVR